MTANKGVKPKNKTNKPEPKKMIETEKINNSIFFFNKF